MLVKTLEDIEEMASNMIDARSDKGIWVFVNTNDKEHLPHFHVKIGQMIDTKWHKECETRIRLDTAEYYNDNEPRLTLDELIWLDKNLDTSRGGRYIGTNWEYACDEWNIASIQNTPFEMPSSQPDYTSLEVAN